MNKEVKDLLIRLREMAFQRLVDRDCWNIGQEEVNREIDNIITETNYGLNVELNE